MEEMKKDVYLHLDFCHDFFSSFSPGNNFGGKTNPGTSAYGVDAPSGPFRNIWPARHELKRATAGSQTTPEVKHPRMIIIKEAKKQLERLENNNVRAINVGRDKI